MYGRVQIGVRQAVKGITCFLKTESNDASLLWLEATEINARRLCVSVTQSVQLFAAPQTVAYQPAPLSMDFSRQK